MEPETLDERDNIKSSWIFPRVWSGFLIVLILVTIRLWCVQESVPPVSMLTWADRLPDFFGWLPVITVLLAAGLIVRDPDRFRRLWWLIAVGLVAAFIIDQHRLQPWAYQSGIYAVVFATMWKRQAQRLLIPLAASVYIYSAAGKLDFQFVHTVGQDFLNGILGSVGMQDAFDESFKARLACLFPITELLAGLFLLPQRTRRRAGLVVMAIHFSLIVMLGPWGMNHSLGVLVWNIALFVQAWFLFVSPSDDMADGALANSKVPERKRFRLPPRSQLRSSMGRMFARGVVIIALIGPATERPGLWDHWTSWALYSPHSSRAAVEIHQSAIDSLPPHVRPYLRQDDDGDGWQTLALDQWSLHTLGVPVYPQARYQLGLAVKLAESNQLVGTAIRCRVRGASNRLTGARAEQPLLGIDEMRGALKDYWLVAK